MNEHQNSQIEVKKVFWVSEINVLNWIFILSLYTYYIYMKKKKEKISTQNENLIKWIRVFIYITVGDFYFLLHTSSLTEVKKKYIKKIHIHIFGHKKGKWQNLKWHEWRLHFFIFWKQCVTFHLLQKGTLGQMGIYSRRKKLNAASCMIMDVLKI